MSSFWFVILSLAVFSEDDFAFTWSECWDGSARWTYCRSPVLGLGLGVDFTFDRDNNNYKNNKNNSPHLFLKGTVLGDKEHGVGIREKKVVETPPW